MSKTRAIPPALPGMTIGLFGGSFDPAHEGHLLVAEAALKRLALDRVWWLVSPQNPLKAHAPDALARRLAGAAAMTQGPRMIATDLESRLGLRFSADTLRALRRLRPGVRFVWVMGADGMAGFHRWRRWREILARTPVLIVARPGAGPRARLSKAFTTAPRVAPDALRAAPAPAWAYLPVRESPLSSTALRSAAAAASPPSPAAGRRA